MQFLKYKQAAFLVSVCLKMPASPDSLGIPRTAELIFQLTSVSGVAVEENSLILF